MAIIMAEPQQVLSDGFYHCKIKQYIQPFERILAIKELNALCNIDNSEQDDQLIPETMDIKELINRLSYWESITTDLITPTKQVLFEATYYSSFDDNGDLVINRLPNTRILRYGPHNLHEYRGKFFPQLVKALINISRLPHGAIVIDPFCGSGTTNVAAAAMGMHSVGVDLNPLSVKISRAKINIISMQPEELKSQTEIMIQRLNDSKYDKSAEDIWESKERIYLDRWFDQGAIREIAHILQCVRMDKNTVLIDFWELCLSNILRAVSWQKETDLRVRKEINEYNEGTAISLFIKECMEQLDLLLPYLTVYREDKQNTHHKIIEGNTTQSALLFDSVGKCDALITSPPYATALPYLDTDRLSLLVLGLLKKDELRDKNFDMIGNREISESQRIILWQSYLDRKHELPCSVVQVIDKIAEANHCDGVGFRRRNLPALLAKYFLDMLDAMKSHLMLLKDDACAYYIVGSNSTRIDGQRFNIETDKLLWDVAKTAGFAQDEFISMELLHSRDVFKDNRGTAESILCLRKRAEKEGEHHDKG